MEQLNILTTYMFLNLVINSFYNKSFCDRSYLGIYFSEIIIRCDSNYIWTSELNADKI